MPFLSLGLNDDKDEPTSRPEGSVAVNDAQNESRSDSSSAQPGSILLGTDGVRFERHEQLLPPEIESLREKLSKKNQIKPVIKPLASSVNPLSSSERYGVPTFATFKFGYVPTRGLLYSSIAHEIGLLVLFLMFTYGLPVLRPHPRVLAVASRIPARRQFFRTRQILRMHSRPSSVRCWYIPSRFANLFRCQTSCST